MKSPAPFLLTTLALASVLSAQAPTPRSPTATQSTGAATADPVVWSATQMYSHSAKNMLAAAQEMPADKYPYSPTPGQMTFAKLVSHVAQSNGLLCSALSGTPAPESLNAPETASKPDLIAALQASFTFCDTALAHLQDAQLGQQITLFRSQSPRARALFALTGDLEGHYSQMAGYLRLNGMLPPSAQPRK
jgi:uncharacterized damage-inducible protein DinB